MSGNAWINNWQNAICVQADIQPYLDKHSAAICGLLELVPTTML